MTNSKVDEHAGLWCYCQMEGSDTSANGAPTGTGEPTDQDFLQAVRNALVRGLDIDVEAALEQVKSEAPKQERRDSETPRHEETPGFSL
jgi:hypothetical protein